MKGQNTFRGPWPAFQTSDGETVIANADGSESVFCAVPESDLLDCHLAKLKAELEACPFAGKVGEQATVRFGDTEQDAVFRGAYPLHDGRGGIRGWSFDFQTSGTPRPVVGPTEADLETLAANVLGVEPEAASIVVSDTGAARSNDTADVRYDLITPIGLEAVAAIYTGTEFCADPPEVWLAEALDDAYAFLGGDGDEFLAGAVVGVLEAIQALSEQDRPGRLEATGQSFKNSTVYRYDLIPPAGLTEVAKRYAIGAKKYEKTRGPFNWERGLDANDIINHGIRHLRNYLAGDLDDEDALLNHLGAAAWNFMAAIHSLKLWPSLNAGKFRRRGCRLPEGLLTPEQETKLYGDAA